MLAAMLGWLCGRLGGAAGLFGGDVLLDGVADVVSQVAGDGVGGDEFEAPLEGGGAANLGQVFGERFVDHGECLPSIKKLFVDLSTFYHIVLQCQWGISTDRQMGHWPEGDSDPGVI